MDHFTAHRLRFVAEVISPIEMHEHMGAALRGAFFNALTDGFCMNKPVLRNGGCPACPLVQTCPVAFLAATLDPQSDRGANVPRPFTVEPPLPTADDRPQTAVGSFAPHTPECGGRRTSGRNPSEEKPLSFAPHTPGCGGRRPLQRFVVGGRFEFGLTMFARALNLFPYVVLSLERMGRSGLGKKVAENGWRRGTFRVSEVWAENPFTGQRQPVLQAGDRMVTVPDVPVTHTQVCELAVPGPGAQVRIDFLTPTHLKDQGEPVKQPEFRVLFQRLMERLEALSGTYSDTPLDPELKFRRVGQASRVQQVAVRTHWVQLESYSARQGQRTSISGIMGHVVYEAEDWEPFWPWLKWGEVAHVGKHAVKGDGIIRCQMNT